MKKYTDTELLNVLLPMLNFSTNIYEVHSNPVKFQILRGPSCSSERDFIIALQNRIDEITKMADVRVTDQGADDCEETEDIDSNDNEVMKDEECQDNDADSMCCDCVEATYSSKEYYDLKKECIEKDHEIWKLKRTVEALEYLIYNCIPKDDRRKYYN